MKTRLTWLSTVVAVATVISVVGAAVAAEPSAALSREGIRGKAKLLKKTPLAAPARLALAPSDMSAGIVATKDAVLAADGSVLRAAKKGEALEVQAGPYDKMLGAYFLSEYRQSKEGYAKGVYVLFDQTGKVRLEMKNIEGTMVMRPSPDGGLVIGYFGLNAPAATPIFYYGTNRKLAEGWPQGQHADNVYYSPDGKIIGIATGGETIFYDNKAKKLWIANASGPAAFSNDSKRIVIAGSDRLLILDGKGAVLREISAPGVNKGSFVHVSGNGKKVVVVVGGNQVRQFDTDDGKAIWSWDTSSSGAVPGMQADATFLITGARVSADGSVTAISGTSWRPKAVQLKGWGEVKDPEYLAEHIVLLAENANILDVINLPPGAMLRFGEARFALSSDGKSLAVPTKTELLRYETGR